MGNNLLSSPRLGQLIFGVLFLAVGIFGALDAEFSKAWIWVGLLVAAGCAGLASAIGTLRKER